MDRRAAALDSLGRTREAIDASKDAAALWREGPRVERYAASMWMVCGRLNWVIDVDAALVELRRALEVLQAAPVSLRAPLLYLRAATLANRGDAAEALETLAEADGVCAALTDPYAQASGALCAAVVTLTAMRMAPAAEFERRTRVGMTALGRPWEAIDVAYVSVLAAAHQGRLQEAAALIDELEPRAERIGNRTSQWALQGLRAALRYLAGDLAGAERIARGVVEFVSAQRHPWVYLTEVRLAEILFLQGRTDEAIEVVRHVAACEQPTRYKQHSRGLLFRYLSYVAPDAARAYLRDTEISLPAGDAVNAYGHWVNLMNVVEGLYVLGERAAVATLRPLTERLAASDVTVMAVAALPRGAAGLAAACAGAWDAAEVHFTTCLTLCDTTPIQVGQGTTREFYADMLLMRNAGDDAARAATLYAEAAENYDAIGLVLYASRLAEKRARLNLA